MYKVAMDWNGGPTFSGHFVSTTTPVEYKGRFGGILTGTRGQLVKGAVASWNGEPC